MTEETEEFVFSEPPPSITVRQSKKVNKMIQFLRDHPHEWVRIRTHESKKRLDSYAGNIKYGSLKDVVKGEFETSVGEVDRDEETGNVTMWGVWAKWVGLPEDADAPQIEGGDPAPAEDEQPVDPAAAVEASPRGW